MVGITTFDGLVRPKSRRGTVNFDFELLRRAGSFGLLWESVSVRATWPGGMSAKKFPDGR
jgi:hypothetical protein